MRNFHSDIHSARALNVHVVITMLTVKQTMVECILALVTDSLPFEYEACSSVIVKCD